MSLSKPFLSPGTCSHGTERHSLAEAAPALPTIQRGFPNRITVGAWGSETFYVVGPALGTAGCLATAWSLPEERQYHPSTWDSQNVPTQCHVLQACGKYVSPTGRKSTTPILAGSELPRHQHSPKCYVPGHHYPSPSRGREVSTETASREGRDLGGKAR